MTHIWTPEGYLKLFVSHLSEQHLFAGDLRGWLEEYGISAFVAHVDIEPTQQWQDEIESALDTMDALIALLHPNFYASLWCDQEVGVAIGRKQLVLSVKLGADPHGFIGKYQALQGYGKNGKELAEGIATILATNPKTAEAAARGAVTRLRNSGSFNESKRAMNIVERIAAASPDVADLLESAPDANDQVAAAWGVRGRITAVVQKWRAAPNQP